MRYHEKLMLFPAAFLIFVLLWVFTTMDVSASGRLQTIKKMEEGHSTVVVVIDPGHGGENEGTIENGFLEKSMTLITSFAMYEELSKYENVEVYLTRTEDVDMNLKERAEFAKSVDADFLFSIHYNASLSHRLFGSEVWISIQPPFNAYGYQFGHLQLSTMEEMGLFLRGIKTRINDRQTDYYGIIRESTELGIPSVLIEHCHVDEERDSIFCDSNEKLQAFGRANATVVAKYFGLRSDILGVDYSENPVFLPEVKADMPVISTLKDESFPDVCIISLLDADYDNGTVTIEVNGADYDSMLLYYDYSIDGGLTFTPLQQWPDNNALAGSYTDTFHLTIDIPSGTLPRIQLRAYNLFDAFTESNILSSFHVFSYGEDLIDIGEEIITDVQEGIIIPDPDPALILFDEQTAREGKMEDNRMKALLTACLLCIALIFPLVLILRRRFRRSDRTFYRKKDD